MAIKRIIDIIGSIAGLVLFFPFLAFFSFVINLSSPGSVVFTQKRVGINSKSFKLYKLRTMHSDSEKRLTEHLALNAKARFEYSEFRCLNNDPRVAGYWAVIARKYSIDEVPQFLNVLIGDMSLVGPRPLCENDLKSYIPYKDQTLRQSVKPGLTGLWQVHRKGKHEAVKNMAELDVHYIKNHSVLLDIKLLMKTAATVFKGVGQF
jgi:lipopolysaccharide/colanic/teichoic acid biosynthesis glycosyltransferase